MLFLHQRPKDESLTKHCQAGKTKILRKYECNVHVCRNVWQACSRFLVSGNFSGCPQLSIGKQQQGALSDRFACRQVRAARGFGAEPEPYYCIILRIVIDVLRSCQFSHYSMTSWREDDWTLLSTSCHYFVCQKTKSLGFEGFFPVSSKLVVFKQNFRPATLHSCITYPEMAQREETQIFNYPV